MKSFTHIVVHTHDYSHDAIAVNDPLGRLGARYHSETEIAKLLNIDFEPNKGEELFIYNLIDFENDVIELH